MALYIAENYINHDTFCEYSKQNNRVRTIEQNLNCLAHEDADTTMVIHVCQLETDADLIIWCSDTDHIIILLGNMNHIRSNSKVY